MRAYDCIIRGGTVIHHNRTEIADIAISGGAIAFVGDLTGHRADRDIQARGKRVIPGGIDPHTHLDSEYAGLRGGDTVHSGTVAAAYGGTTCLIDFAAGSDALPARVENRRAHFAAGEPVIDFGLHCVIGRGDEAGFDQIQALVSAGVSSVKYYMNNSDPLSDGVLLRLLEESGREGILVCVHAENEAIAWHNTARLVEQGRVAWRDFGSSRPVICEMEAVQRAIALAQTTQTGIYIMHVSAGASARCLEQARKNDRPIYGETCAHYLTLTEKAFDREQGQLYKVAPPLRAEKDREDLWKALCGGTLQAMASDHVSYTREEKQRRLEQDAHGGYIQDFTKVPDGLPGIELRLPTLINGALEGRISWETLVNINSYLPARLFGLHPHKGDIASGFDADIVILDEGRTLTVNSAADLHMNCDHTPFEGITYRCLPDTVLVRGQMVIDRGIYTGIAPGKYRCRSMERALLKSGRAL